MGGANSSVADKQPLSDRAVRALKNYRREEYEGHICLRKMWINNGMMSELCEWMVKLKDQIIYLDIHENWISSEGASLLFDTLKESNASISEILIHENRLGDECMKSLGEYIKSNKYLSEVDVSCNDITDAGIEILAKYLIGNTTCKILQLSGNEKITSKSLPILVEIIKSSCIEEMDLSRMSHAEPNILLIPLSNNIFKYKSKYLSKSNLDANDEDVIKICNLMKKYGIDKLEKISLKKNQITSKGASVLFNTLKESNSIVSYLDLSENQLDDECIKSLGEYLQDNECVKELKLEMNKITDKGVEILSEYLIGNTKLNYFHMSNNEGITDESAPYIIEMAKKSCITYMNLYGTSISKGKKQEIDKALSIPTKERETPIKSNTKSAAKIC